MLSWQRMIYLLCLAIVEATPAAVPLVFAGAPGAWGLLILVVLAGALADWLVAAWLPVERQRPALLGIALALALWAIKGQVSGWGPFAGWGTALGALFALRGPQSWLVYLLLLITLYAFRRGTRLVDHDSMSLRRFFGRASVGLILILGMGFLLTLEPNTARLTLTTFMLLSFFAIGLLAIALASAAEEHDTYLSRLGWRGMLTLGSSIGLVLALGLLFTSIFGQDVAQVLGTIARGFFLVIALMLLPIMLLLVSAIEWIAREVHLEEALRMLLQQRVEIQEQQQNQATELLGIFPAWAQVALRIFFSLLPILIIAVLFLLVRRRARRASERDEERESLWSWSGLAADLRDLFAGLRRAPADQGLRGALARLRGGDPVSRIRRSYIRLLLAGEAHEHPRPAPQTPREFAPNIGALLPAAVQPIAALTEAYERARYHPASASDADADTAERAWEEIDAADRQTA